jgi:GNAT superfamily N-acetyltransferase
MNQSLSLHAVDPKDSESCKQVAEFVMQNYKGAVPVTPESVRTGSTRFFWALQGSQRVGITGYIPRTATLAETVKTVIDPAHRGKGLGVRLSQAVEDEVRRAGFKKIMTTIYIDNHAMILIKLKQGYRFEGFHPDHEKPGWHEYSFGKVLE